MLTEPALSPKKPKPSDMKKTWRVWFRYTHQGKTHQVIRKGDLNTISDYKERLAYGKGLITVLKKRLADGWNPITNTYPDPKVLQIEQLQRMDFCQSLEYAKSKLIPVWKPKTLQDYSSKIKYLKAAARDLGYTKPITELTKADYRLILERTIEMRKGSAITFNGYKSFLSGLITEICEWDILEVNPVFSIKSKEVQKNVAHRPPTQDQRVTIVSRIKEVNWNYYRFLAVLYGCGIRPVEITRIKVKHLHKMEGIFRLPASITKNKKESDVAIPKWVMELLMELKTEDPEQYLFGKGFVPGFKAMGKNAPHNTWKKIVKEGLGIDVNQYGLKKLSADDLVRLQRREGAGNLLSLAKEHFRHHSEDQTKVYTSEQDNIYREIIREKMPEL